MKTLIYKDYVFKYETFEDYTEFGTTYTTVFYLGTMIVTCKKYWLFGETITKEVPKPVFEIYEDSNNTELSKQWWINAIEQKVNSELLRRIEIENGELI